MAITASKTVLGNVGTRKSAKGTLTLSGTYTAGGEVVTARSIGLEFIEELFLNGPNLAGITAIWDGGNVTAKVVVYDEDNTSGISAPITGAVTGAISYLAFGF